MRNIIDNNKLFAVVAPKITLQQCKRIAHSDNTNIYYYFVSNKMYQVFT